jgi:hypothetical protein
LPTEPGFTTTLTCADILGWPGGPWLPVTKPVRCLARRLLPTWARSPRSYMLTCDDVGSGQVGWPQPARASLKCAGTGFVGNGQRVVSSSRADGVRVASRVDPGWCSVLHDQWGQISGPSSMVGSTVVGGARGWVTQSVDA